MSNEPEHFDEETGEIKGDRNISVASQGGGKAIGMAVIGIVAVIAIGALIYDEMTKNKGKPVTELEEITFRAPKARGEPFIASNPTPAPAQDALQSSDKGLSELEKLRLQQQLAMQAEALRQAQERQKAMEARIKSPQLVYDKSKFAPTQSGSGTAMAVPVGGASLLSGGQSDPNLEFAREQRNAQVASASATQLLNLETLIAQGKMISGVLETAIQSDLPGMVRAITSENVYSFDSSNLLIPKGTRLIGQYRSGVQAGQSRVFIIWNRLIRPDGASINISSFGTDSLGRSGLGGEVDTHFMQRFSSSILLSMIDGALNVAASAANNNSSNIALGGGNDFSRSSEIALENSIGIQPTIYIDQGKRIKIFVGRDLDFSNVGKYQ